MKNFILTVLVAASCFAGETNQVLKAKLSLNTGKEYICDVVECKNKKIVVNRVLSDGMTATEYYDFDKINRIDFVMPAFLTNVFDLSTKKSLNNAKRTAKKEYEKYKPFAELTGKTWAARTGFELAKLYEKLGTYPSALKIYSRLSLDKFNPEIARFAVLRKAVCSYQKGIVSNSLPTFEKALEAAETDAEIAELNYYIGKIKSELGDPVAGNFILLKNVIFYNSEGEWEPKSLQAALKNYAVLDRENEFTNTCNNLIRRFPDTDYSAFAETCLKKIEAGDVLTNLFK